MTQTLNGLMMDSLAGGDFNVDTDASNEETDRILQEASAVAEQQIGDRFPSVPSPSGVASQSTLE
jgi:division protein CdvB (Snf7/Vps24/ESCRT-III family)